MSAYSIGLGDKTVDWRFSGTDEWCMTYRDDSSRWEPGPLTKKGWKMILKHFDLPRDRFSIEKVRTMSPTSLTLEHELLRLGNPNLPKHTPRSQQPGNNVEARLVA